MGDGNPYFYLEYDTRDMQSLGWDLVWVPQPIQAGFQEIGAPFP